MRKATLKHFIAANAAVFAMVAAPAVIDHFYSLDLGMTPAAYAADGTPKGQQGKPADKGHKGQGGAGQDVGGSGSGQGGPSADSDAKGPRYGGAGAGGSDRTGKPVWAQEGIPEVELGRLSVIRAPVSVSSRQLTEALAAIATDPSILTYYTADASDIDAAFVAANVRLDSPLANLALLRDLLADGKIVLNSGVELTATAYPDLAAILLGSASDKTISITTDTVTAIWTIIGATLPTADTIPSLTTIAEDANSVRDAINTAHGE